MSKNKKIFLYSLFSLILVVGLSLFFSQTVLGQSRGGNENTVIIGPGSRSGDNECVNHGCEMIGEGLDIKCVCPKNVNCIDKGCKWVTNSDGTNGKCVCNKDSCKSWDTDMNICNDTTKIDCLKNGTSYWDDEGKYCVSGVSKEEACLKKGGIYDRSQNVCGDWASIYSANGCTMKTGGTDYICPDAGCSLMPGCTLESLYGGCKCEQSFSFNFTITEGERRGDGLDDYPVVDPSKSKAIKECISHRAEYGGCKWVNGKGCICENEIINCLDSNCQWIDNKCICKTKDICKDWVSSMNICNDTTKIDCLKNGTSYWDDEGKYCVSGVSKEEACLKKGGLYNRSQNVCGDWASIYSANGCKMKTGGTDYICPDAGCSLVPGCTLESLYGGCKCEQKFKPTSSLSGYCQSAYCGGCSIKDYTSGDIINEINFPITQICTTLNPSYPLKNVVTKIANSDNLYRMAYTSNHINVFNYKNIEKKEYPTIWVDLNNVGNNLPVILGLTTGAEVTPWYKGLNYEPLSYVLIKDKGFWERSAIAKKYINSIPETSLIKIFTYSNSDDAQQLKGVYYSETSSGRIISVDQYLPIGKINLCSRTDAENYSEKIFCSNSGCTWNSDVKICLCQHKESCEAYGNKWEGENCIGLNDIDRCNNIKTKSGNEGCYWDNNYGCICSAQKNCEMHGCKWINGKCICGSCAEGEIKKINGITGCLDKEKSDSIIIKASMTSYNAQIKKYASFTNKLLAKLILKDVDTSGIPIKPSIDFSELKFMCNNTKGCAYSEDQGCQCVSAFCNKGSIRDSHGCFDKKNINGIIDSCTCPNIFTKSCGFKNPWFINNVDVYHFGGKNAKSTDKRLSVYISDCKDSGNECSIEKGTENFTPFYLDLADNSNSEVFRKKVYSLTNNPEPGIRLGDYDAAINYFLPIMQIIPSSLYNSTPGIHIKTTKEDSWTGQVLSSMERTKINSFTVNKTKVNKGDSVVVSWDVINPVYNQNYQPEIYMYPNIDENGNVIDDVTQSYFIGKLGEEKEKGSINVKLQKTTTFYLTVKGISGEGVVYLMADPIMVEVIGDGSKVDLKIKRITKGNDTRPYSDGAILIDKGDGVGLKWDSFNVNYCNVSSTPTISLWDGIKTVTGTVSIPGEYLDFGTTTFNIQCKSTLSGGGVVLDQATAIVVDPNSAAIGVKTVIKDSKGKTENYEGTIDFKLIGPQLLPDGDFTSKEYNVGVIDTENGDDYTLEYLSGGPNDSSFVGITPNAKQKVKPHSTTVYTMEFFTTNDIDKRAKINVRATLDGKEISKSNVNYKLIGPNTENKVYFVPSTSTVAIKNSQGDSYTLAYDGGLSGANLVSISPSDTQTVKAGELVTFTLNFESCSNGDCCPNGNCLNPNPNPANPCKINIVGKYNNSDWNGNFAFNLYGPEKLSANSLPYTFDKVPGNAPYSLYSQSGGPTNAVISEISPSNGQVCPANGEITFTVNFADIASEKPSITLPPKEVGNNKPVAKIACNADDPSTCSGTIDNDSNTPTITLVNASTDSDGDIKSCLWEITGRSPINSCSAVTLGDEPGTYKAKLTVTDSRGNTDSTTITATVKAITELTVKFVWNPKIATAGKEVQFYDRSLVPKNVTTSLLWSFEDATTTASSTLYDPEPKVIFNSEGTKKVTLTVTASNGEKKSLTQEVSVKKAVPQWKEVNPNQ